MATELEELIQFLSAPSAPIRKAAVNIIRDCTGSEDGLKSLARYSGVVIPAVARLLTEKKEVSEPAAEVLVNLSQNPEVAGNMVKGGLINIVMDILHKQEDITHLLVMLLLNLTQLDTGIEALLQNGDEKMHGMYVMKLVRAFCASASEKRGDPYEHVASILVNISKKETGRHLLLDPKRGLMKQILRQFDSSSLLRKKGVSGTIRNCCFEAENQLQNLLLLSEFLWPALLLPVAGKKIYSEQDTSKMPLELASALSIERETATDPDICIQTIDAIYLILLQEAGRRAFWAVNGPRILEVGYEDEADPQVMEAYERVGSLLVSGDSTTEAET